MLVHDEGLKTPEPLTDGERRVLGVLIEKSLTTPDAYPMTLKGLTTGCNQKSNRDPIVSFDEDDVEEFLDSLREKNLVHEVHTAGGRTEKFRHVARVKFGWGEVHVAVMGELLLRGRQQIGELRSRAGRMRDVGSLEEMRASLAELQEAGFVRASGPLERRGVEVDHGLHDGPPPELATAAEPAAASPKAEPRPDELATLHAEVAELREEVAALRSKLDAVLS